MGFSAIIAAQDVGASNDVLEAGGFGPENFSVALWDGGGPDPVAVGLNEAAEKPAFRAAVAAILNVSIRDTPPGVTEFDEHVASLGLDREPPPV
jgi:hypothetical protein